MLDRLASLLAAAEQRSRALRTPISQHIGQAGKTCAIGPFEGLGIDGEEAADKVWRPLHTLPTLPHHSRQKHLTHTNGRAHIHTTLEGTRGPL